jgi:hypothetical protein
VPFSNKRYQHREVSAKFLLLSHAGKIVDTKKAYLDGFVKDFKKKKNEAEARELAKKVKMTLDKMAEIFTNKDELLKTQAMVVIYYLAFEKAIEEQWVSSITRRRLVNFEEEREANRKKAEADITKARYELLEFDRMALQGSNDAASIRARFNTLTTYLRK